MQERGGRTSALFRIQKVLNDIDLSYSRAHGKKVKLHMSQGGSHVLELSLVSVA